MAPSAWKWLRSIQPEIWDVLVSISTATSIGAHLHQSHAQCGYAACDSYSWRDSDALQPFDTRSAYSSWCVKRHGSMVFVRTCSSIVDVAHLYAHVRQALTVAISISTLNLSATTCLSSCCIYFHLNYILKYCILCIRQFQQSGTVYTRLELK